MIEYGFQIQLLLMQTGKSNNSDLFVTYSNCKLVLPGGRNNSVWSHGDNLLCHPKLSMKVFFKQDFDVTWSIMLSKYKENLFSWHNWNKELANENWFLLVGSNQCCVGISYMQIYPLGTCRVYFLFHLFFLKSIYSN